MEKWEIEMKATMLAISIIVLYPLFHNSSIPPFPGIAG
jgi:hypothetical protein